MKYNDLLKKIQVLEERCEKLENIKSLLMRFKSLFNKHNIIIGATIIFVITTFIGYATITKPYSFTDNTVISADEINQNFDTLYTAINRVGKLADNNGTILGSIANIDCESISLITPNGYIVVLSWDGNPDAASDYYEDIFYSGASCSGDAYFYGEDPIYGKATAYNSDLSQWYVPDSIDPTNGLAVTTTNVSFESYSAEGSCSPWSETLSTAILLTTISQTDLGLPATIEPPLEIIQD